MTGEDITEACGVAEIRLVYCVKFVEVLHPYVFIYCILHVSLLVTITFISLWMNTAALYDFQGFVGSTSWMSNRRSN